MESDGDGPGVSSSEEDQAAAAASAPAATAARSSGSDRAGHHRRPHRRRHKPKPAASEEEEEVWSSSSGSSSSPSGSIASSLARSPPLSPPPSSPARELLGKTSAQANQQLIAMFSSMAAEHEQHNPFPALSSLVSCLLSADCLCGCYAATVCLVGYGYVGSLHMLVEGLLIVVLVTAVVALNMWKAFLEHSELVRLLRARMDLVLELPSPPPDGRWRPLPANLLVQGDLIELDADDPLPGLCSPVALQQDRGSRGAADELKDAQQQQQTADDAGRHRTAQHSAVASHSHHVVHPSLSASPFHSFSHPPHSLPHQSQSWQSFSHVHDSHPAAYPRSYPRLISPPAATSSHSAVLPPPPHPPSPSAPQPPPAPAAATVLSSRGVAEEAEDETKAAGHSLQPRRVSSMSSISSLASQQPPSQSLSPTAASPRSLPSLISSPAQHYLVVEPPLRHQLSFLLRPPRSSSADRPPPPLAVARARLVTRRVRALVCGCFLLYLVLAVARIGYHAAFPSSRSPPVPRSSQEAKAWYVGLLYHSALLLLSLSLLPVPLYLYLLDALGNAHLLVLQEAVQTRTEQGFGPSSVLGADGDGTREKERIERERRGAAAAGKQRLRSDSLSSVSTASSLSTEDADDINDERSDIDDHATFAFIDSLPLPAGAVLRRAADICAGREPYMTRTVNPLLTLGTVTTFCCLDAEGILSENEPSPDHLLLFSDAGKPQVLDIINDPHSANGISMEGEWRRFLPALKPIGLNCALCHQCNMREEQLCEFAWAGGEGGAEGEEREVSGCLCPLAREIGFDVKWIRQQYFISKVLYNVTMMEQATRSTVKQKRRGRGNAKALKGKTARGGAAASSSSSSSSAALSEPNIRSMMSVSIQDRLLPDSFHLLSSGDPLLVFHHCSAYWDGAGIAGIDAAIESSFLSILQQWRHQDLHCIAFAYTPVPSAYYGLLLEDGREREYLIDSWSEGRGWERKRRGAAGGGGEGGGGDRGGTGRGEGGGGVGGGAERQEGGDGVKASDEDGDVAGGAAMAEWKAAMGAMQEEASEEEQRRLRPHRADAIDDSEEVLLEEATDVVDEARGRRVRWDSLGSRAEAETSSEEKEDSTRSASDASQLESAWQQQQQPHHGAACAMPVHVLSIPLTSSSSSSLSQQPGLTTPSQGRLPASAAAASSASISTAEAGVDPPAGPPSPQAPPPPPLSSSSSPTSRAADDGNNDEVRISISSPSPSLAPFASPEQHAAAPDSLSAPLLSQGGSGPLRRLHLHPSSSVSTASHSSPSSALSQPVRQYPAPAPSRPSSLRAAAAAAPVPALPPRPVSTPTVLHSLPSVASSTSSSASGPRQPLSIIPSSSQSAASLLAAESLSARVDRAGGRRERRSRAFSLSHSQSHNQLQLAAGASPASFLPTLQQVDSAVLPFSVSSPPTAASALSGADTPPPIVRPHNTPVVQPVMTAAAASAASGAAPLLNADVAGPGSASTLLPTSSASVLKQLQHDQLFLGMVAMRDQPKTEVRSLVEHLMAAGVRFVFFSPENERKTQAFGGKIGLFTDFNVYISLQDVGDAGDDGREEGKRRERARQGKSQLPCGVSAIREHIHSVDNVPLLVSLFTDCSPPDVKEMIRIYQENGESVMVMGSSLKVENSEAFMQADISVSLDPIPSRECKDKTCHAGSAGGSASRVGEKAAGDAADDQSAVYSDSREFAVSSAITSMPCALPLSLTTDLMQFIALICEGRRLLTNVTQALSFGLSAYLSLFLLLLLTFALDTPPLFTGYQLLWLISLIIPLLSFSLFFSPRSPDIMQRLADKNIDIGADHGRHSLYLLLRFLPSIVVYALFFLLFLHASFSSSTLFSTFYWQSAYSGGSLADDPAFTSTLLAVQVYSQCVYVLALIVHSACYLHRYDGLHRLSGGRLGLYRVWLSVALCCFVAQLLFAVVSVLSLHLPAVTVTRWLLLWLLWPALLLAVDELIKLHDRRWREFCHNRARSHFDTVLGMHSPL